MGLHSKSRPKTWRLSPTAAGLPSFVTISPNITITSEFTKPTTRKEKKTQTNIVPSFCDTHNDPLQIPHHILHRDISSGNMLIVDRMVDGNPTPTGMLNDWELSKYVPGAQDPEQKARQPDRTVSLLPHRLSLGCLSPASRERGNSCLQLRSKIRAKL